MAGAAASHAFDRLRYHHSKLYLAGRTLVKMDRATMAAGLEAHAPFLDHAFAELGALGAGPIASGELDDQAQAQTRAAWSLAGRHPEGRKHGFGIPIARWLRGTGQHHPLLWALLTFELWRE